MMKEKMKAIRTCPLCHEKYAERPAVSRVDGITPICPLCGTRQALESLGVSEKEQEQIVGIIQRSVKEHK